MISIWKNTLSKILISDPIEFKSRKAFTALWDWMYKAKYNGACHDSSVVLFILFNELDITSELCIGEIQLESGVVTDHSWVESEGLITDIAISMPNNPNHYHAPLFFGKSLAGGRVTCTYGKRFEGLSIDSLYISNQNIGQYLSMHPWGEDFIFKKAKDIGKTIGLNLTMPKLRLKYSEVKRSFRSA
ncbi:hypothetical protein HNW13_017930 [Shewanella sp. BF02_Schw]|uniref:hypothetical protein n=1 Tax=Shewanella sp. BF02_Schw TaxID=394908 RepID=UPI0017847AF8|nr:hypothetical protein [Shewanella sp. BF02_Schw]MBO1897619.1 hypothetical protein [Shewanella sp. BF02_Schw]